MANINLYKDLSFSFEKHPVTGDLLTKTGKEAIKQSVKNIVLTEYFERSDPKLGSNVYNSLFELNSFVSVNTLKERLKELVLRYEPRIDILEVFVATKENNRITITLSFTTYETTTPVSVELFVQGIR